MTQLFSYKSASCKTTFCKLIYYKIAAVYLLIIFCSATKANDIELPSIGSISTITVAEEKRIGKAWLKQYRRHVPVAANPILTAHLENLIAKLAVHSDLQDPNLSLVVAKNNTLNAFAVPGGIIGVHTGLLTYAKTESQLASVLAHELAHLSQRHYARGVEKQKSQRLATIGGFLASLILLSSSNSDAGLAALSASQAYTLDQQLRFSRSFEREADRLGMKILLKANMSPHATSEMFEEMERLTRFSSQPPEFLLTHPLTSNRIVDAINFARPYPKPNTPENTDYQFIRAIAILESEESPQQAIIRFKNELSGFDTSVDGSRYGLMIAYSDNEQITEATEQLNTLLKKHPQNRTLLMTESQLLAKQGKINEAIQKNLALQKTYSHYYPLKMQLAQFYRAQQNYSDSNQLLDELSQERPEDPSIWYELAEVSGLNNNISLLHKARAEFFILYADFENAEQQLYTLIDREKQLGNEKSALLLYAQEKINALDYLREQAKI